MPKKLLLHVGCPKTGTSSIQDFLVLNRQDLLDSGFYIPSFLQRDESQSGPHAWTTLLSFEEDRIEPLVADFCEHGISWADIRSRKKIILAEKLHQYGDFTWIVSDEILSARMKDDGDLERLGDLLVRHFNACEIIFFIRNQLDSAIGQWTTDLMNGSVQDRISMPDELPEDPARYLDHKSLISRWATFFSDCKITVRRYSYTTLIENFMDISEISSQKSFKMPSTVNKSLSESACRILLRFNSNHPHISENYYPSAFRRYIPIAIQKAFAGLPKPKPSRLLMEKYMQFFKESDEWMLRNFFPNDDSLWCDGKPDESEASYSGVHLHEMEESICELLSDLTFTFQQPDPRNMSFGAQQNQQCKELHEKVDEL